MDGPEELRDNEHGRMAVWANRIGYAGLSIAIAGLVAAVLGSTPRILELGVGV